MTAPILPFVYVLKGVEKYFPVVVILEDRLLLVSPESNVINCASIFYAKRAGHTIRIAKK